MTNFRDFEFTTFLSPWYFKEYIPNLGKGLKWKYIPKLGITKLLSRKGCLALIDSHCYIKPVNSDMFLIWERGSTKIELYETNDLAPITNTIKIYKELRETKKKYYFCCKPANAIEYFFDLYQTEIKFDFPEPFRKIDEIIQVNDISGMYKDYQAHIGNTAIVVIQPKLGKVILYPQDWFNRDDKIDFGYQWITRAERNLLTGKIHLQGIRIDEYILDETNRQIER